VEMGHCLTCCTELTKIYCYCITSRIKYRKS